MHEQLFFDDNSGTELPNIGYGNRGRIVERDSTELAMYRHDDTHYDDEVMREVVRHLEYDAMDYALLGNNCQNWAERVRHLYNAYFSLFKAKARSRR